MGDGVNLSADYGLVFYGGALGQMASFKVFNNGVYFKVEKDWRTTLEAFNLNLGYGGIFENRWLLNVGAGYSHYDLSDRKTDQTAIDFTFSPGIQFKQGLQLNVGYEYLSNRMYTNDNRFFASFKHSFFKGLTQ